MERLPDTLLLRKFLDGDELAFRALYRRHSPRLRALVFRLMGHRAEAEDVLQETWLSACRGIHTFRGESQFSTWLTTIGIRAVHARFRRSPPEALVDLPDDLRASSPPAAHHAAIDHLDLAIELYDSPRIEELSRVIQLTVVESSLDNAAKEVCIRKIQSIRKKRLQLTASVN